MKQRGVLTIMAFILSFPLFVSAHGDATHVLGTVTETAQDHLVVQTRQGESVTLVINADTIFQRNGMTTKDARPEVGNRMVAEAEEDGDSLVATKIRFSSSESQESARGKRD